MKVIIPLLYIILYQSLQVAAANTPIILIPGLAGSALDGMRGKTSEIWEYPYIYCPETYEYDQIWPFPANGLNWNAACWPFDITVDVVGTGNDAHYVNYTRTEMHVIPHDFTGLQGISELVFDFGTIPYYSGLIKFLKDNNYKNGTDLFGAPFDWRLTPVSLSSFSYGLEKLVEYAVKTTGKKALIVAHSYGNLILSQFLMRQTQEWKDLFVKRYVAVSGPFLGAAESPAAVYFSILDGTILADFGFSAQQVLETFPSMYYLAPNTMVNNSLLFNVHHEGSPIVQEFFVNEKSYHELMDLFLTDLPWKDELFTLWLHHQFNPDIAPGVDVSCFYGIGLNTSYQYDVYLDTWWEVYKYTQYNQSGDGTVLETSANYIYYSWNKGNPAHRVEKKAYKGQSHLGILQDPNLMQDILDLARA